MGAVSDAILHRRSGQSAGNDGFADADGTGLHPELEAWAGNVGSTVAIDVAAPLAAPPAGLTLVCWNLAIGAARLHELLGHLRRGAFPGLAPDERFPLVLLVQEAYRADASVPAQCVGRCHGGRLRERQRHDIADLARQERLSLRYAPSMRNGLQRSDRGNAILSTVPFRRSWSFLLPYVRQRRVAVAAELVGIEDLVLVSAHLDTGGRLRREAQFGRIGGGRLAQAQSLAQQLTAPDDPRCVVIGADLNTPLGVRDPAVLALVAAGMHPATRCGHWWHTFHGPLKLLLDHVLFRSPSGRIAAVQLHRLDEAPGDVSRRVFGSDHHPLLARVLFREPPAAA
jgi:endonuclease/exonuclease/phosphatase family metal-dependent hydrolase